MTAPDLILSTCSQNECSFCESNYPVDIIETKKEVKCSRDDDGHKFSPYKRYHLSNMECNQLFLKMLGLDGHRMQKKKRVVKKRKSRKIPQNQQTTYEKRNMF